MKFKNKLKYNVRKLIYKNSNYQVIDKYLKNMEINNYNHIIVISCRLNSALTAHKIK
jgi:hypothetical protein